MNPLKEAIKIWLKLDTLTETELESPEAERLRDEGAIVWRKMTAQDKESFRQICQTIDLNYPS